MKDTRRGLGFSVVHPTKREDVKKAEQPVFNPPVSVPQEAPLPENPAVAAAADVAQLNAVKIEPENEDFWTKQNRKEYGNMYNQVYQESVLKDRILEQSGAESVADFAEAYRQSRRDKLLAKFHEHRDLLKRMNDPDFDWEGNFPGMHQRQYELFGEGEAGHAGNSSRAAPTNDEIFAPIELEGEDNKQFVRNVMNDSGIDSPDLSIQMHQDDIGNLSFKTLTKPSRALSEAAANSLLRRLGNPDNGKQQYLNVIREMRNIANEQKEKTDHYMNRLQAVYYKYYTPIFNGPHDREKKQKPQMQTLKDRLHIMANTLEKALNVRYKEAPAPASSSSSSSSSSADV